MAALSVRSITTSSTDRKAAEEFKLRASLTLGVRHFTPFAVSAPAAVVEQSRHGRQNSRGVTY